MLIEKHILDGTNKTKIGNYYVEYIGRTNQLKSLVKASLTGVDSIVLSEASCDSETVDLPMLYSISLANSLTLFGGEMLYKLTLGSVSYEHRLINRDKIYEEFWYEKIHQTKNGDFLEYEGGIILFDNSAFVKANEKKFYDEKVTGISDSTIELINSDGETRILQIR